MDTQVKLSYYLTEDTDMTTLIELIDYANSQGYQFVVYYSSAAEKKKLIEFRINNNKEFETYYVGEKGKLNINFDKVVACNLSEKIFVNRKIEALDISGNIKEMARGTLMGSIINQLSIPYIGGNSLGTITEDGDCNYFTWLFGEDKFTSSSGTGDKNVEEGSPIDNLPNTVVINSNSIPAFAFSWCSSIKSIELATNLESVGEYAFYQIGTTSLDIPKSLSNIGDYAFYSEKLQKINWISYKSTINDKSEFILGEQGNYFYLEREEDLSSENLIIGGDFSEGVNENNSEELPDGEPWLKENKWNIDSSRDNYDCAFKKEEEECLSIVATATLANQLITNHWYQDVKFIKSDTTLNDMIFYVYAKVRGNSKNSTSNLSHPRVFLTSSTDSEKIKDLESIDNLTGNELNDDKWHILSTYSLINYEDGFDRIGFGIYQLTEKDVMDIKEIAIFNLTEIFGIGNEPTKEWCDKVLAEKNDILYPEINSIKFLNEFGKQAEITEAENSEYTFDYENGLVKKSDNVAAYFSLPYYIFASKLNIGRYPHFVENNGSCGKNLDWFLNTKIDENGNEYYSLNISGTGSMLDFDPDQPPWKGWETKIKEIVLSEKITSIGNYAFKGCSITTFKCPQNLETIGSHSFEDCSNLEEVIFSDKLVTIGDYAFKGCKMQTVVLPDNIKKIGKYAFSYNSKLVNVDVSKAEFVGEGCFSFCSILESLSLPFVGETASATGLKGIIGHVIGGESSVSFEDSNYETVKQIYENVLNNTSSVKTQEYKIPMSLKEINIKNGAIRVGAFSGLSKVEKIIIEDATSMGINIFWGTENLKEIKVPYKPLTKSITSYYSSSQNVISYLSFNNGYANFIERLFSCSNTSQLGLYDEKGVQIQILPAYRDTTGRMYIQIPLLEKIIITNANLSQVGKFSEWRYEDWDFDLELPDNMEPEIKNECFENSNIKNLNINVIPTVFNQSCFKNSKIKRINNLTWSELFLNTTKIYQDAFNGKNFDEDNELVFFKLTNIDKYAFRNVQVNSLKILGSITIPSYAFDGSLINKIEINGSTYIQAYAFFNCNNLTRLKFVNIGQFANNLFSNCPNLEEIITPFVGITAASNINPTSEFSFFWWFKYTSKGNDATFNYFNYPYNLTNQPCRWSYRSNITLPKLKKIIITGENIYLPSYMFYDVKRWFANLEGIYFINLNSTDARQRMGNNVFDVYNGNYGAATVVKYWYFSDEFDVGEILPVSSYRMSTYSDNSYSSEENLIVSEENEQRVIKLLSDKDYSWKALLYGKDYDVYITDNNTYADGSSYLPKLYLPNNSRMEQGQQITLIGENAYNITDLEAFSCSNKIFYRQSKGILNGKLSYFNTVTGTVTKLNNNWVITDENFKSSITEVSVNFTIGSVFDSNHIDGTIEKKGDVITITKSNSEGAIEVKEGDTITIEKALVTEGSIDANLINVIREGSKFTTTFDGQLQTVNGEPDYYNIKFTPGFYVGDNGYNNVNITIADETLILPNDLLSNTVLLSIETYGKLTLEGTTGDNIKKGIISENLIGIIKKGVTSFVLMGENGNNIEEFIIKDVDRNNNQIVFENEEQNGFIMENETVEYKIKLKNYIDIADADFDTTDLHLTLNHINIFDIESIKKYEELETSSILKEGEILYLITTKEPINPTDYEVLERSLEKEFVLERYTTIATVETIDKSNIQHILVYPDTFYEIKSNCIETPQYYFQTSEKQDTIFYINDEEIEKDLLTGQNIINLESSSAKITAKYQGNLIWYKWTIQENIDGEYYTIKEFIEYYNPNIILNYDLFRNNTEYRLILTTKTKEDLEVNAYLYVDVNYGIDLLDNIIVDKDCIEKAIKISFLGIDTKNKFSDEVFVTENKYGGIEHIYVEEEDKKLYAYLGEEKYLFYNSNISYDKDYTFSYKVTTVGNVAIRFYDTSNNNISENVVEVIKDGFYDAELKAIVVEGSTELLIPYYENLNISYFNVGFYAPKNFYFSEMQLEIGLGKTEYEERVVTFAEKGIRSFIVLREDVDDENSLCKLGEVDVDTEYFYDYSFNRESTYQYYIVPVFFDYINGNDNLIYGPPHKLNNQINYNLKEVTLIDTVIDTTPNEETQSSNIYEANNQEYSMWHFKYNTDAKSINVVTDKTVYETSMKIPVVNKTKRNYKTGTIKAFLGGFVKENNKLTYRDSIKLQNKFQEFCDNGRVKMLRDEIGNVLPVDVTLTSFEYNPHTIPTNITVTFEWTQVGEENNLSVWRSE